MLERRTNQGMMRLIQPKHRGCVTSGEKPSLTDKVENGPVAANGNADYEGKTQHEKTDETNNVPSHAGITKSGPVNVSTPPAAEKRSPLANPGLGKLTYNPITHAPSMCEFICPGSTQGWVLNLSWYQSKYICHSSYLHSDGFVRSPAGPPHYYHSTAANRRRVEQTGNGNATLPPTEGTNADEVSNRHQSSLLFTIYLLFSFVFSWCDDILVAFI